MPDCQLCGEDRPLEDSHIVPAFVLRQYKRRNPGRLRLFSNPNQRIQDGLRRPYFCRNCEALFNQVETRFCNEVFVPLLDEGGPVPYGEWAVRFLVSVSYRVLLFYLLEGWATNLTSHQHTQAKKALRTWRRHLLGHLPEPRGYPQHFVPVDIVESFGSSFADVSPAMNRYLVNPVQIDLITTDTDFFVYTKMYRFLVFGEINNVSPDEWENTQLSTTGGHVGGPIDISVPGRLYGYLNDQAEKLRGVRSEFSPKQEEKIAETARRDAAKHIGSDLLRGIAADHHHNGNKAFQAPDDEGDSE